MRKGFTLLELIVVIIIIGILGTLGFTQYAKVLEKGRTAEAKAILGQMRTAQEAYFQQYGGRTATLANLAIEITDNTCDTNHYYKYTTDATTGTATRCQTGEGGKAPSVASAYTVSVTYASGTWGGSAGYY